MKGPHSSGPWTALFVSFCHKVHAWAPTVSHHRNAFSQASTIQVAWNPCHPTVRTVLTSSRYTATKPTLIYRYLSTTGGDTFPSFQVGDKIQVEVISFGPLGASVGVVGIGHGDSVPLLPVDAEPYATGLILQQEIAYFRQSRGNVDVVRGEVLPAYIQKIREEDGKIDVALRSFGGKAKADEVSTQILNRLRSSPDGTLPVGDKSTPEEINQEFPGVSKAVFKKAVGALYKQGEVAPSPRSIALTQKQAKC